MSDIMNEYAEVCAERDSLKAELADRDKKLGACIAQSIATTVDRDAWKAKAEKLEGKTGFCSQCEIWAKKAERYEKALRNASDVICGEFCGNRHHENCKRITAALEEK